MKQSVERESVLDAMREMYASGIVPTRRNWNANRPSGLPLDRTINKAFGEKQWANIVAMAVDVEIKCKESWGLATEDKQKSLVVELISAISVQIGHRPGIADWDEERPPFVPRAQHVGRMFGLTWAALTTKLVVDNIGSMKEMANSRRWGESVGIKVASTETKRIWLGPNHYRTVCASMVI